MTYSNKEFFYENLKTDTTQMYGGDSTDALFQQLYDELRGGNIGLFSEVKEIVRNNDFAQAYIKNQLIPDASLIESNKKAVNEIYIYCQLHDTVPDSAQTSILENIAFQFPIAGGEGVYMARAMLHLHIEDQFSLLRKAKPSADAVISNMIGRIYPNPTSSRATYKLESYLSDPSNLRIQIDDAMGKAIYKTTTISDSQISINCESFSPGIYYFHFFVDNVERDKGKFIIVK